MSFSVKFAGLALVGLFSAGVAAAADLEVSNPWVRGTVSAQKATGAFMQLSSKGGVSLVGVGSPAANIVEIHEMVMDNNVMKMRALPRLEVEAGKVLELKPGSYHVMLIDVVKPVNAGDKVPLTLVVEGRDGKRSSVEVSAEARAMNAAAASPAAPMHQHQH